MASVASSTAEPSTSPADSSSGSAASRKQTRVSFEGGANLPTPLEQLIINTAPMSKDARRNSETSEPDSLIDALHGSIIGSASGLWGEANAPAEAALPPLLQLQNHKRRRWIKALQLVLGLRSGKTCWGLENCDFGVLPNSQREEWCAEGPKHEPNEVTTWWTTRFYQTPQVRHLWGEPQYELHPGSQELFLDLIFVGVAYRIGSVLMASFYACTDRAVDGMSTSSTANGTGGAAARQAGRALATLSNEYECIGLSLGLLHALAPFMCMYMVWQVETSFRAKYRSWSKVHACLDVLGNLLLLLAGMNVGAAQDYRGQPDSTGLARVLVPIIMSHCLWMIRTAELVLFAKRECARRQSTSEIEVQVQVLVMWVLALMISSVDFGAARSNADASDAAAALMWAGNLWWLWRKAQRPIMKLLLPGPHLSLERSAVCNNMGFIANRNNEFMFLMLGETVLQIVIADRPSTIDVTRNTTLVSVLISEATATATAGLILAVAMMFSFRQMVAKQLEQYSKANSNVKARAHESDINRKQSKLMRGLRLSRGASPTNSETESVEGSRERKPTLMRGFSILFKKSQQFTTGDITEEDSQRLLLSAQAFNVVTNVLFTTNALAVMLVGVGVKLAINFPDAPVDSYSSFEMRMELGVPVAVVFSIQLINAIIRKRQHYSSCAVIRANPGHVAVLVCRGFMLAAHVIICYFPLRPVQLLALEAAMALVHTALLHAQEHRFPLTSDREAAAAKLGQALQFIRIKASRERRRLGLPDHGTEGAPVPEAPVKTDEEGSFKRTLNRGKSLATGLAAKGKKVTLAACRSSAGTKQPTGAQFNDSMPNERCSAPANLNLTA